MLLKTLKPSRRIQTLKSGYTNVASFTHFCLFCSHFEITFSIVSIFLPGEIETTVRFLEKLTFFSILISYELKFAIVCIKTRVVLRWGRYGGYHPDLHFRLEVHTMSLLVRGAVRESNKRICDLCHYIFHDNIFYI
jgi:hypothetical protein